MEGPIAHPLLTQRGRLVIIPSSLRAATRVWPSLTSRMPQVLMPGAAYTLEVPVNPVDGMQDVVVQVTIVFPEAEVSRRGPDQGKN